MNSDTIAEDTVREKIAFFMDRTPGLVSFVFTLIVIAGFIG